jgi:hypothetical protein
VGEQSAKGGFIEVGGVPEEAGALEEDRVGARELLQPAPTGRAFAEVAAQVSVVGIRDGPGEHSPQ